MQELLEAINDPKTLLNKEIAQKIFNILQQKLDCQFVFNGDTYCHITGQIIGKEESIIIDDKTFNKATLKATIMDQFCDDFNAEFEIQTYNKKPFKKEFNEQMFQNLLGDSEFQKQRQLVSKKYEELKLEDCIFICPITKQEYLKGVDSFIFQNKIISVEGALEIYKDNSACFLHSQKLYLESKKQQTSQVE